MNILGHRSNHYQNIHTYLYSSFSGFPSKKDDVDKVHVEMKYLEISGISIIGIGLPDSVSRFCRNYAAGHNMKKLVAKFISAYRNASEQEL